MRVERDWLGWHAEYDQAGSRLSRRLASVQRQLAEALAVAPAGPIRLVSACAGEARDVVGVLPEHPRRRDVTGLLIEADPTVAARARTAVEGAHLDAVTVLQADAGRSSSYASVVPANVLLFCGVFGNITPADVARTILEIRSLSAPGAVVLWTRGRQAGYEPHLTICRWFESAGFEELDLVAPVDDDFRAGRSSFSAGMHRLVAAPSAFDPDTELFNFLPEPV